MNSLTIHLFGKPRFELAARLSGAADVFRDVLGTPPDFSDTRAAYDGAIKLLHENLTESAFNDAVLSGRCMTMEYVLDELGKQY